MSGDQVRLGFYSNQRLRKMSWQNVMNQNCWSSIKAKFTLGIGKTLFNLRFLITEADFVTSKVQEG